MDASDRNKQCKKLLMQIKEENVSSNVITEFQDLYQPVIQEYLSGEKLNNKALGTIATDELSQKIGIKLEKQAKKGISEKDYEDSTSWIITICTFELINWKCPKLLEQMKNENLCNDAFKEFYFLYQPIVKKYLGKQRINNIELGVVADDISQNVFYNILERVKNKEKDEISIKTSCKGFIIRICRNEFLNCISESSLEEKSKTRARDRSKAKEKKEKNPDKKKNKMKVKKEKEATENSNHEPSFFDVEKIPAPDYSWVDDHRNCLERIKKSIKCTHPDRIKTLEQFMLGYKRSDIASFLKIEIGTLNQRLLEIRKQINKLSEKFC